MNKKPFIAIVMAALGISLGVPRSAAVQAASRPLAQLKWTRLHGRVAAIHPRARMLELVDPYGNVTAVSVDDNVQILRSYRVVGFETIRPADKIELRYLQGL